MAIALTISFSCLDIQNPFGFPMQPRNLTFSENFARLTEKHLTSEHNTRCEGTSQRRASCFRPALTTLTQESQVN